ncbi:hypothetical protein [Brevibacterium samyangense]|uniref:Uncharacterized protein n=1 Tax=Brevibacterium samyangense TaxID=366888 RepID=A0ABP5F7H0_9MICO
MTAEKSAIKTTPDTMTPADEIDALNEEMDELDRADALAGTRGTPARDRRRVEIYARLHELNNVEQSSADSRHEDSQEDRGHPEEVGNHPLQHLQSVTDAEVHPDSETGILRKRIDTLQALRDSTTDAEQRDVLSGLLRDTYTEYEDALHTAFAFTCPEWCTGNDIVKNGAVTHRSAPRKSDWVSGKLTTYMFENRPLDAGEPSERFLCVHIPNHDPSKDAITVGVYLEDVPGLMRQITEDAEQFMKEVTR